MYICTTNFMHIFLVSHAHWTPPLFTQPIMATSSSPSLSSEDIFKNHYLALQSLCDPVSVTRLLYGELMLTGEVLNDVESAGPSLKKQREALLVAVKEAVQIRDGNLQTFASVLCKFTGNMKLGIAIHRDYGKLVKVTKIIHV